ncbi:hypothetical protein [Amycolatopsis alkalitolerans]|uniref:Uncharacterized protein n=1 Tax=Amycolatopsis alkalitolerans TaxID=2547244 RepID=A0A5C4LR94_9PSEU|nr:hypothetical protein [Amycolatopsis alkalitolerans]TNC19421.1 hypothetical protein FG385_32305 [Amycolatopsis alkalitolerans]
MELGVTSEHAGKRPASIRKPARLAHLRVDPRGYPIIATVDQAPGHVDFGSLSEKRKLALATFDLCAVCGLPFAAELRWQVSFEESSAKSKSFISNEAPVHEVCGLYAAQVCPFVSSPYARLGDQIRKGMKRPGVVFLTGFQQTKRVFGGRSGLQNSEFVLHFENSEAERSHRLSSAADAAEAYQQALDNELEIKIDDVEQELTNLLTSLTATEGEDSGSVMAGAAWFIGGAFCPGVGKVQGMERFARDSMYTTIARRVLEPEFAKEFEETNDIYARVAVRWLNSRRHLPKILANWRSVASSRMRHGRPSLKDAREPVAHKKAKRKLQNAARRRNRR